MADEGVKQVSCFIPYNQYKLLKEIADLHALSVYRLVKKGIGLVIEQYMENNEINEKKEGSDWNDSQEPSES